MELEYTNKALQYINEMNIGDEFIIDQRVHPNNREQFADVVKLRIRQGFIESEWIVEFKSDYSAIRKIKNISKFYLYLHNR